MNIVIWRSTPDHTLSAVFRELSENCGCRLTVVCIEDIRPHRKKLGWRLPDFGQTILEILPEHGWEKKIDEVIADNRKAIHIFGAGLRFAKIRYAARKVFKNNLSYGAMFENPVNQGNGLKWILKEIYLHTILKYANHLIANKGLFLLTLTSLKESLRIFPKLGWPKEKIFPFGYFPEAPAIQQDLSTAKTTDVIELAYVGMLIARKGVHLLIKALGQVKGKGLKFRCNIIGNGIFRQDLELLTRNLGLQDEVIFRGSLPNFEARALINECDILVAPGNFEPWGMPVNEGIQSGLAVVVSDSVLGGSDLVRASGAGQVFAAGDVGSLTEALLHLMADPVALSQAKQKAQAYAWRIAPGVAAAYLKQVVLYSLGEVLERPAAPWLQSD